MKAIILAGGFGTRLRPLIGDSVPKCMAPIMGRPMIEMIIRRLQKYGISDITLALHHLPGAFLEKYGHLRCVIEKEPLGTGGAIKNCLQDREPVIVTNGDTFAPIEYDDMILWHYHPLTIAVDSNGESAGTYILDPEILDNYSGAFSFERDVIPNTPFRTHIIPWFTDFGTPEAYKNACKEWV